MEIAKGNKTALVFGATGLVGSNLVDFLSMHQAYKKIIVFNRREISYQDEKIIQQVIDFDHPETYRASVKGDDLFLCLGTTRAKAGSKEKFYQVDFQYNFQAAEMAAENGVNQVLLVSSVGADEESFFYYSQVKGALEAAIKKLPFWAIHIFQPSVLLGSRNENRWGEEAAGKIGKILDRITGGLLMKYKPVEADVVAKAMVEAAQKLKQGIFVYPSNYLQILAEETDSYLREINS